MKKLVVSGCSFTFEDWNWPRFLGECYGLSLKDIVNVGMGSQGNGLISKKLIYAVTKELETQNPKDLMVGIMWSGVDRVDFHSENNYNSGNWGNNGHISNISNPTNVAEEKKWYVLNPGWGLNKDSHPLMDNYYEHYHSNVGAMVNTIQCILITQWFLKEKKVPYFMTTYMDIFNMYDKEFLNNPEIKYLYDLIDFSKFLPIRGCFEYIKTNFPEGMPECNNEYDGHHPLENGHKFFSENAIAPFISEMKKSLI